MAIKTVELQNALNGQGCLGKAKDDEPVFILRAQDKAAPGLVRRWAEIAEANGCPSYKVQEAYSLANQMDAWQQSNPSKWPD